MGQPESPSPLPQGKTSTEILEKSWKKRLSYRDVRHSQKSTVFCIVAIVAIYIEMNTHIFETIFKTNTSVFWYIESWLLIIFVLAVIVDCTRFLWYKWFNTQVPVTETQKRLLGVRDNDPGFTLSPIRSPGAASSEPSLVFSSSTPSSSHTAYTPGSIPSSPWGSGGQLTPTNLGSLSDSAHGYGAGNSSHSFLSNSGHASYDRHSTSLPIMGSNASSLNMSSLSNASFHSGAYSPGASLSSLDWSGLRSRLSLSSSVRSPSPSDKMTDLQSLSMYLKDQEDKEFKASLSSQVDASFNSSSFWSYGRPSLEIGNLGNLLRKSQYQLASRSPQSHKSRTDDTDNMGEEVWRPLGVTDDKLFMWIERLRKWLGNTIMVKLAREIDSVNSQLRKIGCEDTEIGEVGVSTLKQLALTKGPYVPTLNILVPYLDFSSNQEYLIKRIKELGGDGCISEYVWNKGGTGGQYGKQWSEHLPTDAQLVMHMFCTYMDSRLPPDLKYPDGKTFTSQHVVVTPDKPDLGKDNLLLYQSSISPPHFHVVVKDTIYSLPKGRNNMFHAILYFLHHIRYKGNGMLGRVNLGMSGVNILSVLDE
ncbi:transmembrane protein 209-like isoform X2 [Dreissena polymorpha]|nr:transmembrane protein 209-like isoform X2 [Dreissena polymorpha]